MSKTNRRGFIGSLLAMIGLAKADPKPVSLDGLAAKAAAKDCYNIQWPTAGRINPDEAFTFYDMPAPTKQIFPTIFNLRPPDPRQLYIQDWSPDFIKEVDGRFLTVIETSQGLVLLSPQYHPQLVDDDWYMKPLLDCDNGDIVQSEVNDYLGLQP